MPAIKAIDSALSVLGIQPSAVLSAVWRGFQKIGDKKARLGAVEISSLVSIEYNDAIAEAVKGKNDETANAVRDALLGANRNTLAVLARVVDLDESIGEDGG